MNKTLLKDKLKSYSALASAVFGTAAVADAQIVYTDVNPDATLAVINDSLNAFDVNFDNAGAPEMSIATYGYLYNYGGTDYQLNYVFSFVAPDATAALVASMQAAGTSSFPVTTSLASGTAIGSASTWLDTTAAGGTFYFNSAYGFGQTLLGTANTGADTYIGARFLIGANTHYGWVRINVAADASSVTIKDYAYNGTANGPINAGQTVGIAEIAATSWNAYSNGTSIIVKAEFEGNVEVIDMTGNLITSGLIANGELSMDVSNASAGMYLVRVTNGTTSATKKISLK
jgi:hypothetical protein